MQQTSLIPLPYSLSLLVIFPPQCCSKSKGSQGNSELKILLLIPAWWQQYT